MAGYILQEDGVSKILLEDGSGALLQEGVTTGSLGGDVFTPISEDFLGNPAEFENGLGQGYDDFTLDDLTAGTGFPFIGSRTTVFAPAVQGTTVALGFIASATVVHPLTADAAYTAEVKAGGPAFYWKLADAVGSATVADSSGNSNNGAVHGSVTLGQPSLVPALPDTSAELGGTTSDWIEGGDWDIVGSAITLECWVKPSGIVSGPHVIAKHSGPSDVQGALGIGATAPGGTALFEVTVGGVYKTVAGRTKLQTGVGYHLVGVYDGAQLHVYVNGIEDSDPVPATGTLANNAFDWSVGALRNPGLTIDPFAGWIDEVAVYPSALTADEVWKHFELGEGLHNAVGLGFIPSKTAVYAIELGIELPFIPSSTVVYAPDLPEVNLPFIASRTHVWDIFSLFDPNKTYAGPGNGGETFLIRLAPNGTTVTATLAADITADDTLLTLTGDGSFPATVPFVVTIGSEVIYLVQVSPGTYRVRGRAMSNTTAAAHTAGATVSWGDSYDMALRSTGDVNASFTADILSTGTETYYGWLICFDSSQAYLGGSRYPMHVGEVLGVFDAGAGSTGPNRCDSSQPNAVHTPTGVSDSCPAALSNPALITTDIVAGDVAVVRYTNPEASALDLGPRSTALQSWFGLKRVSATDADVTLTDPNGYVVDTIPSGAGPGPFTGSVNHEWPEPIPLLTGIAPDASDAAGTAIDTPNPVPWTTVTLPGADRYFTDGIHYSEKGWPMCCLAVRQGNRRIPFWQSWDWHDYGYVYNGFGDDDTFCQLLINRNGIVFGSVPEVELPGPQDIDGPDAVWDDASYYVGASWYVAIFSTPYIVFGPTIGGSIPPGDVAPGGTGIVPGVTFPPGGGPVVIPPPPIEGGSGGGVDGQPVSNALFQAAAV